MHQTLIKKVVACLASLLIILTCTSCKAEPSYKVKDYLNYLAIKSGIGNSEEIESNFEDLLDWHIVEEKDRDHLDDNLKYEYLSKTINKLLESENNSLDCLVQKNLISKDISPDDTVKKEDGEKIVDKAVNIINHKSFDKSYEYEYINEPVELNDNNKAGDLIYDEEKQTYYITYLDDENEIQYREAEFEEVFSYFDISDSFEIDFENSEVIPYHEEETDTSYVNNKFNLLASKNHVFNSNGFRISYTLNSAGIDVHVSSDINKMNVYGDLSLKKVKPTFKWTYDKGDLKNCYFNVTMNTTEKFGVSTGKYDRYYLTLKDLDSSSFMNTVKSMFVKYKDNIDATIPICKIKTPIPNVPTAYIDLDLLLKLSASGRVELVLYNSNNIGFEIKQGHPRFIFEYNDDLDAIARATAKAAVGVNVGLDAATFRICDIELDGGLKAELKTTVHLYDEEGNMTSKASDIPYSVMDELSIENNDVKVCGDVSFCWIFDVIINTSKTKLYKLGFSKTFHILDDDNQVFGNLHHIENGQFVKKCTRRARLNTTNTSLEVKSNDKITLNSYAEVLLKDEKFNIEIKTIPDGYKKTDILYLSENNSVASVSSTGVITAISPGNAKIQVYTSDNQYSAYVNVLVSTG